MDTQLKPLVGKESPSGPGTQAPVDRVAAARLVVGSRETAAFTLRTRPPLPVAGQTTAVRQAVARTEPDEPSGVQQFARRSPRSITAEIGTTAAGTAETGTHRTRRTTTGTPETRLTTGTAQANRA